MLPRKLTVAQFSDYKKVRDLTEEARRLGFAVVTYIPMELEGIDRDAFEQWLKEEGRKVLRAMRQEQEE